MTTPNYGVLNGVNRIIRVPVWIAPPEHYDSVWPVSGKAMLDTGASICAIDTSLANTLGLRPLGRFRIWQSLKGREWVNVYVVRLKSGREDSAPMDVHVMACDDLKRELNVWAIIGMDLIAELRITRANGLEYVALQQPKYIDVSKPQNEKQLCQH